MSNNSLDDFFESDLYKKYEAKENEKRKFIKTGPNVIHLEYFGAMLTDEEIKDIDEKLTDVGLEFSRFDKNGTMYACLDKFELVSFLAISQPILFSIIKNASNNAIWEIIKYTAISIWRKTKNKNISHTTSKKTDKKELSFGLKIQLDRNTNFNFKLDGDVSERTIENSLDKIFNFLAEQKKNEHYKPSDYVYYDKNKEKWIKIDVEKEIHRMINENKLNEKNSL